MDVEDREQDKVRCPRCMGATLETDGLHRGRWCRKCRGTGRVWADRGSNPEPSDYESRALTIELPAP